MLLSIYVEGALFFKALIFKGEQLFIDFVADYEMNHMGEVTVTFLDEENKNCNIEFTSFDAYHAFEKVLNSLDEWGFMGIIRFIRIIPDFFEKISIN